MVRLHSYNINPRVSKKLAILWKCLRTFDDSCIQVVTSVSRLHIWCPELYERGIHVTDFAPTKPRELEPVFQRSRDETDIYRIFQWEDDSPSKKWAHPIWCWSGLSGSCRASHADMVTRISIVGSHMGERAAYYIGARTSRARPTALGPIRC